MLRLRTLIMFLVVVGVTYGTMVTLDLVVDRTGQQSAEQQADAQAIFGATEPASLEAKATQPQRVSAGEAEIRRIARQVAEAAAARVATDIAREEVSSQL